ncbi:MAG: GGDEF domain-containing protein [Spirochaetia bacterium]|nr:GGDEF domain-containing protein [Spirochaetia bacterium]
MTHTFFVRTSTQKVVQEAYWSQPVSLAIPFKTTLEDLFDEPNKQAFNKAFTQALWVKQQVFCSHVCIIEDAIELCFFVLSLEQNVWVLAIDYFDSLPLEIQEMHKQVLFHMIEQFAILFSKNQLQNSQVVYNHFEQIQKLNNQLVNTQRDLQRANRKLEVVNQELNNRLVKDPLTNLVSRYQYRSEMEQLIRKEPEALGLFAFIDIDAFKQINDTYGHAIGDQYLVEFSKRIQQMQKAYSCIAMRIAGDEFGLYVHGLEQIDDVFIQAFYKRFIQEILYEPLDTEVGKLQISCSIGIAIYNQDTSNLFELIDFADWAMYEAKRAGRQQYKRFERQSFQTRFN